MVAISRTVADALRAYEAGNLFEAEWICDQLLQQQPQSIPVLHLLGAIALQTGRLETAIARYRELLSLDPHHFEAHNNLAVALHQHGDFAAAQIHFEKSLERNPYHAQTHFNLGNLRMAQDQVDAAISDYQQALELKPDYARAWNNLAIARRQQGNLAAAINCYQQAIAQNPQEPQFYSNLGNLLLEQGEAEAAIAQYQQALALQPEDAVTLFNLGNALSDFNQYEAAIAAYQQALQRRPNWAEAQRNLALALQHTNQHETAIALLQQAIAYDPNDARAYENLGILLYEQRDLTGAIAHYEKALAIDPLLAEAHFNLGIALLAAGNFQRGYAEYEWRWQCRALHQPPLPIQRWDGADLKGQRVLLYAEQGFGDAIQFVRYAPLVAQRGGQVFLECPIELVSLFSTLPEVVRVIPRGETLPDFDRCLPLMSLPLVLGEVTPQAEPTPYLRVPTSDRPSDQFADLDTALQASDCRIRIGIVWASGRPHDRRWWRWYQMRSIPLKLFSDLLHLPNAQFFSLQVGVHSADIQEYGLESYLTDLSPHLGSFAATAAAIAQLDLVLSVDTAVAHLAGALGKPVWTLLPYAADWRWGLHSSTTPWYPSMRLFRQEAPGSWAEVLAAVLQQVNALSEQLSKSE